MGFSNGKSLIPQFRMSRIMACRTFSFIHTRQFIRFLVYILYSSCYQCLLIMSLIDSIKFLLFTRMLRSIPKTLKIGDNLNPIPSISLQGSIPLMKFYLRSPQCALNTLRTSYQQETSCLGSRAEFKKMCYSESCDLNVSQYKVNLLFCCTQYVVQGSIFSPRIYLLIKLIIKLEQGYTSPTDPYLTLDEYT